MTIVINKKTYEAGELIAYVKRLEKENAELKEHIKADCIDCADYIKNQKLEKENAELKEKQQKKINTTTVSDYPYSALKLEEAKEIIKAFLLMAKVEHLKDRYETVDDAEAFLKEIDK